MKIAFLHMTMGMVDRGSEISIELLARGLAAGNDVLVLQGGPERKAPYKVKQIPVPKNLGPSEPHGVLDKIRFRLYRDKTSHYIRQFTKKTVRPLKKFDPDIIVATNGFPQMYELRQHLFNSKIVVFGRAGLGYHDADNIKAKPDLFITLTNEAYHWAKKLVHAPTKVAYIPNPIDPDPFLKATSLRKSHDPKVVLTVAALTKYKNVDKVIRAVAQTPFALMVVGEGEEEGTLRKLASHLLPGRHIFRQVKYKHLPVVYKSVDAFCLVSGPQEAFGRVYLEAMAAGLPIVASDTPQRHALIGDKGFYALPDDVPAITQALEKAIARGSLSYRKELEPYILPTVISQIEKEFHGLLR